MQPKVWLWHGVHGPQSSGHRRLPQPKCAPVSMLVFDVIDMLNGDMVARASVDMIDGDQSMVTLSKRNTMIGMR
jgi:hypothetical protein